MVSETIVKDISRAVDRDRLLSTAIDLISIPSPTRSADKISNRLSEILQNDGFAVERVEANWPKAPAVVVRFESGKRGRTLQFDGHLDTVHLPYVPPRIDNGILRGLGAADMKGGIAACVEALRALRETRALPAGEVLFTAHDHHEGPWGDKRQIKGLIDAGYVGDAVLFPEYLSNRLPLAGRGMAIFQMTIYRTGEAIHEVLRPADLPDVLGTGAKLIGQLGALGNQISANAHPYMGNDSVFVGQISSGEIYNQSPAQCHIQGTRRWVQPGYAPAARAELETLVERLAETSNTQIDLNWQTRADAFSVAETDPIVLAFQNAHRAIAGHPLPFGDKPFVDDGNRYAALADVPVLTHGPNARGAHTTDEWVPLDELVRVARVYALTAIGYCNC